MLVIYMERATVEWLLQRIQAANSAPVKTPKIAIDAEMALTAAIGQASIAHNPHKAFGHVQGENLAGNGTTDGLTSATDQEAVESIK